MSAFGLARQLDLERSAAQTYIDRYFTRYPGVARYMEETRNGARAGLRRDRLRPPPVVSRHPRQPTGAARAPNAPPSTPPCRGPPPTSSRWPIAVQRWLDEGSMATRLVLQVHDELVLLVVEVGVGPNWEAAH